MEGISDLRQLVRTTEKFKTHADHPLRLQDKSSSIMDLITALLILIAFLCFIIALLFTLLVSTWVSARNYENCIRAAGVQLQLNLNPRPTDTETLDLPIQDPPPLSAHYSLQCLPTPMYPPSLLPRISIHTTPDPIHEISLFTPQNSTEFLPMPTRYCSSSCSPPTHRRTPSSLL